MKKTAPPDTLVVAGDTLKQARETRNLSIADLANRVTLSREQVAALEEGGNQPFYTASHKLLALRKLAAALDLHPEALLLAVPEEDAEVTDTGAQPIEPASPAAGKRGGERRSRLWSVLLAAAAIGALLIALLPSDDDLPPDGSAAPAEQSPKPALAEGPKTSLPAKPAAPAASDARTGPGAPPAGSAQTADNPTVAAGVECQIDSGATPIALSPPYRRKDDARAYFGSASGAELCVADASGNPRLISLPPGGGRFVGGRPPYQVRSDKLSEIEIYMQGMRVRVPAGVDRVQLSPTDTPAPAPNSDESAGGSS